MSMIDLSLFIDLLTDVLNCAEKEKSKILNGDVSQWDLGHIEDIIIPEISELLSYAKSDKVYFKYGKKQRLLESTYLMADSTNDLYHTDLGVKISALQGFYFDI
ncbi:MAG: hypothetical protein IJU94_06660 [Clostridia bacterium]|nr:hypothetical protein [Clostridia bacterium]